MQKPANAKGTRDFGPAVVRKRQYILDKIKVVFQKFGFEPIQTPALENLSTLTGKYGNEGDKLLFKVLNSGDIASGIDVQSVEAKDNKSLLGQLSDKGLRYDLTVPFARYVVQHRNEIDLPFRRYQIQEVWRADRPQKGRYREFTQCDADVIGSASMVNEADLILIYNEVFQALNLQEAELKINHRKLLESVVDELKLDLPITDFASSLDKLDKIGEQGVRQELKAKGASEAQCDQLFEVIGQLQLDEASLQALLIALNQNPKAVRAVRDLREILHYIQHESLVISLSLDLSLARGLDYYTGCIFEAVIPNSGIGSVSGGGRYDDLTGVFGWSDVSGVGISFGIDRLFDVMEASQRFDLQALEQSNVLLCHLDEKGRDYAYAQAAQLRSAGITAQVYPDIKKLKKQLDYANKTGRTHSILIGDNEIQSGIMPVKDLKTGVQEELNIEQLIERLS